MMRSVQLQHPSSMGVGEVELWWFIAFSRRNERCFSSFKELGKAIDHHVTRRL